MKVGVTSREQEALMFIRTYIAKHRSSPSFSEIAVALGYKSKSAAFRIVEALTDRGHLRHMARRARSLALVESGGDVIDGLGLAPEVRDALVRLAKEQNVNPLVIVREATRAYVGLAGAFR